MNRLASVAVGAVLIVACGTKPNPYARIGLPLVNDEPDISEVEITLQRTLCFGWCPAYTIRVDGSGKVTYTGTSNVVTIGEQSAVLDRSAIRPLLDKFEAIDFMRLEHRCTWATNDAPHPTVSLRVGSKEQSFTELSAVIAFDDDEAHLALHHRLAELMDAIDAACASERWIGNEEERRARFSNSR